MRTMVDKREAIRRKAKKFWDGLSNHDRWELGDQLVLGSLDWRDWIHDKPEPGFWNAVDELRMNWETVDTCGGKKRHSSGIADKRKRVAWMSLSQDARRFMNDLLTMPKYHGGLESNATQNELKRLGLIEVIYGYKTDESGTPRDFVKLTAKGKRYLKDAEYKKWDQDPLGMEKLAAEVKAMLKR